MAERKATSALIVTIGCDDREFDAFQAFERAAVMVGGQVGEAVLEALAVVHADVSARARGEVA